MQDEEGRDNYERYQRLKRLYGEAQAPKKEWYRPADKLPPQGYKVLCQYGGGDYAVMQRFGDLWFPIPFSDSKFAKTVPPTYWQEIDFVGENTGYSKIMVEAGGELMDFDQLEKVHNDIFNHVIEQHLRFFNLTKREG